MASSIVLRSRIKSTPRNTPSLYRSTVTIYVSRGTAVTIIIVLPAIDKACMCLGIHNSTRQVFIWSICARQEEFFTTPMELLAVQEKLYRLSMYGGIYANSGDHRYFQY